MEHWAFDTISFIAGLIGGGTFGSILTFSISKYMSAGANSRIIDQSSAKAGGDIIGGNKKS